MRADCNVLGTVRGEGGDKVRATSAAGSAHTAVTRGEEDTDASGTESGVHVAKFAMEKEHFLEIRHMRSR